jgi:protein-tyrosine phosphatase
VIDLHSHVLAGIDDGPSTIEGSIAIARAASAAGTRTLVATPHVSWRYGNDPATIERLAAQLSERLRAEQVDLEVVPGAELAITRIIDMEREEVSGFGLGGGPWLLVEPPFTPSASGIDDVLLDLRRDGHGIVLAHPERSPAFQRNPRMLADLVAQGVLTSITSGSLIGRFGAGVRRFALELLDAELVHNVASDAHDAEQRDPRLGDHLREAGIEALAGWLTEAVPRAILAGEETIPDRPLEPAMITTRARRRWWQRGALRRAS